MVEAEEGCGRSRCRCQRWWWRRGDALRCSEHLLALNLAQGVEELRLEPGTQDVVEVLCLGGLLGVAPVGQGVDERAALAQLAVDDLPAQRLLHVLVELEESNLDGLHRDAEGCVVGGGCGERGREDGRRGRGGTAERGWCRGGGGLDTGGDLVPGQDLGGDAGVEHREVRVGRAGALEELQHVGDGLLGDGENRVEALELDVGGVLRVDDLQALECRVGQSVAAVLRGHRDADAQRVHAVGGVAPGAVRGNGVGRRQEAVVGRHALREGNLWEVHWVHCLHCVDRDKVPDCLDVGQIELDRLLTSERIDEGKLRPNGLREFELGLKRHVS